MFTIPAGTFFTEMAVNFRARTRVSQVAQWSEWSNQASFALITISAPLAPVNLRPYARQNPTRQIRLEWTHSPGAGHADSQDDSEVEYWQGAGARTVLPGEFGNRVNLMAGAFTALATVSFRARTHGLRGGWSAWSGVATFPLALDPPLAPTDLRPTAVQNRWGPIVLAWRHTPNPADWDTQTDSQVEFWQTGRPATLVFAGTTNRLDLPEFTFTDSARVSFRVRTQTLRNGWGAWSAVQTFDLSLLPPLPPAHLAPTSPQNPWGEIRASWTYVANPDMRPVDEQVDSEVRFRQSNGPWQMFNGGVDNVVVVPAHVFPGLSKVEFQARTRAAIHGWGEWSGSAHFELRETPPHAPVPLHPVGIAVRAVDGAFLQWSYNSPYDAFPSRFDVRYRIDGGDWTDIRIDSEGGMPATSNTITRAESNQSRLEWQVRAWGDLGNVGPWSEIAHAIIIGIPPTPAIVMITNSGRPIIHFSAQHAMAWEIVIVRDGEIIYRTGVRAFDGIFTHSVTQFLEDGEYVAQLQIYNQYDISSLWAIKAFTIALASQAPLRLATVNNINYHTRLRFDGLGRTVHIYRTEIDSNSFIFVAQTINVEVYDDWTVHPGQRYKYFVRVVGDDYSFADSTIVTAKSDFKDTTIATTSNPSDMLTMIYQAGNKPTKNTQFEHEKTLSALVGREKPGLQVGTHTSRVMNLAFHVSLEDYKRLEALSSCDKVLILRDWRLGVVYGTITGGVKGKSDGFSDHMLASFSFTETDFSHKGESM